MRDGISAWREIPSPLLLLLIGDGEEWIFPMTGALRLFLNRKRE
jgi:hypothetical protein